MFKLPGKYLVQLVNGTDISSSSLRGSRQGHENANVVEETEIRVAYVRRDVIDLSITDWNNFVDGMWTLKNLSTAEGKTRYNCSNFYNYDVFTAQHWTHTLNSSCDQLHFSLMQEYGHQSFITLMERALQCIHPSISMPFYNYLKDLETYYDPAVGVKSMLDSPMFGSKYFGGGHRNWDDRPDPYDPYYVEDGRFAYFPLRQNRTGLCDESVGLFDDDTYLPACRRLMESNETLVWQDSNASNAGMWTHQPRDSSARKFVSARRWYIYGSYGVGDGDPFHLVPRYEDAAELLSKDSPYDALYRLKLVSGSFHGYAHKFLGGMWGGGINETTKLDGDAIPPQFANQPMLETLKQRQRLLFMFAWLDITTTVEYGCYKCTKEGCSINVENAVKYNCYNINNNFTIPKSNRYPKWNKYALPGNSWYTFLNQGNIGSYTKAIYLGYGFYHETPGTFDRTPSANQDPLFFAHHTLTFLLRDLALEAVESGGLGSPPLYGIDLQLFQRRVPECPGHNPQDTSVFKNLVRYKVGQDPGTRHTIAHIMEMWTPQRRDYEWYVNDQTLIDFAK